MKYTCSVLSAVILLLICGCNSTAEKVSGVQPAPQQFSTQNELAGKALSEKYIAALVKAVQNKDFNAISPFLRTDMLTVRQKRSTFDQLCKRLEQNGKLVSYKFIATANQTLCRDYIWQLNFEKTTTSEKLPIIKTVLLYSVRVVIEENTPEIIRTRLIQL